MNKTYPGQTDLFRDTTIKTNTTVNDLLSTAGTGNDLFKPLISAFAYVYGTDPDLTGSNLDITQELPRVSLADGINTVSFALTDDANRVRLWQFDTTVLTTGAHTPLRLQ